MLQVLALLLAPAALHVPTSEGLRDEGPADGDATHTGEASGDEELQGVVWIPRPDVPAALDLRRLGSAVADAVGCPRSQLELGSLGPSTGRAVLASVRVLPRGAGAGCTSNEVLQRWRAADAPTLRSADPVVASFAATARVFPGRGGAGVVSLLQSAIQRAKDDAAPRSTTEQLRDLQQAVTDMEEILKIQARVPVQDATQRLGALTDDLEGDRTELSALKESLKGINDRLDGVVAQASLSHLLLMVGAGMLIVAVLAACVQWCCCARPGKGAGYAAAHADDGDDPDDGASSRLRSARDTLQVARTPASASRRAAAAAPADPERPSDVRFQPEAQGSQDPRLPTGFFKPSPGMESRPTEGLFERMQTAFTDMFQPEGDDPERRTQFLAGAIPEERRPQRWSMVRTLLGASRTSEEHLLTSTEAADMAAAAFAGHDVHEASTSQEKVHLPRAKRATGARHTTQDHSPELPAGGLAAVREEDEEEEEEARPARPPRPNLDDARTAVWDRLEDATESRLGDPLVVGGLPGAAPPVPGAAPPVAAFCESGEPEWKVPGAKAKAAKSRARDAPPEPELEDEPSRELKRREVRVPTQFGGEKAAQKGRRPTWNEEAETRRGAGTISRAKSPEPGINTGRSLQDRINSLEDATGNDLDGDGDVAR